MNTKTLALAQLPVGHTGRIDTLLAGGMTRCRLLDLGLVPGAEIKTIRRSPVGDPTAYLIRGMVIALREEVARQVLVRTSIYSSKEDSNGSVQPCMH
ncbi:MAG TPA: FeoA family protein [Bacillota bacterium]|nr:FeoA family protein [Bacillota bacterium]